MTVAVWLWAATAVAATMVSNIPGTDVDEPEETGSNIDTSQPLQTAARMQIRIASRLCILVRASLKDVTCIGPSGVALLARIDRRPGPA